MSVSTIEKAGFTVVCSNGIISIKKNKIVYAQGKRVGNLYKLVFKLSNKAEYANLAVKADKEVWHKRYGHLNYKSLSNMHKLNLVNGLNFVDKGTDVMCEICVRSKQKCQPYYSKTTKSSRVLELIHSNVCGPITPESNNGNNYFLTFIDDYSRFVMVYVIKHKSEVFECKSQLKPMVRQRYYF